MGNARMVEVNFPEFLILMRRVRHRFLALEESGLQEVFRAFDRDESGLLSMREAAEVFAELGLAPRTRAEQGDIHAILESVDEDGSGEIDEREFRTLYRLVSEKLNQIHREEEREIARSLGVKDDRTFRTYRTAFDNLDENASH